MLNEEAQEGEKVNRWWVKDKPSEEKEMKEPQDQAGGRKGEEEGKMDNQTSNDVRNRTVSFFQLRFRKSVRPCGLDFDVPLGCTGSM
jgi:hypothetical protein